jgi:hypothetical protein
LYVMVIDAVNSGVSRRSGFCFSNRISCKHNEQQSPPQPCQASEPRCARVCACVRARVCARVRACVRAHVHGAPATTRRGGRALWRRRSAGTRGA